MKKSLAMLVGLLMATAAWGEETTIQFERVSGETNGIAAAFRDWHREELARQGGPGKSHGWWPWGLRAFDYNQDGVLDLLASHHGLPNSMLLQGRRAADGTLHYSDVTSALGIEHRDLPGADDRPWIWDFDGDGRLDIAGFSDESRPKIVWNRGDASFQVDEAFSFSPLSHPQEVVDLDGDGFLDLDGGAKGCWFYVPDKRTFRHDANPRFANSAEIPSDLLAAFLELKKANRGFQFQALTHDVVGYDTLGYRPTPIDLDGDGVHDVVLAGSGGYGAPYRGRYLLRQPDGRLLDRMQELGLPEDGVPILLRDLTGDGLPDLLITADRAGQDGGGVFVNQGRGSFRRQENALTQFLDRRGPYLLRAFEADFNHDELVDLVLSNPRLGQVVVFQNHGAGRFEEVLKLSNAWDANPLVLHDFDQDGRIDLAVGLRPEKNSPGDVHLFFNRTANTGHFLTVQVRMPSPNPYAVGAVVEVYPAGEAGRGTGRALHTEKAHPDGTAIHFGLGPRPACDVRVRFPNDRVVVQEEVPLDRVVTIRP